MMMLSLGDFQFGVDTAAYVSFSNMYMLFEKPSNESPARVKIRIHPAIKTADLPSDCRFSSSSETVIVSTCTLCL